MSHIIKVATNIKNVEYFKKALKELTDFDVRENDYYKGYSMSQEKADFVFKLKGCPYEIGLIKNYDGTYRLAYDPWQGHVEKIIGAGGSKLKQGYAYQNLVSEIKKKGLNCRIVRKQLENQNLQVEVMGVETWGG